MMLDLTYACRTDDIDTVKRMLEQGADVSVLNKDQLKEYKKYLLKIGDLECLRNL